MLRIATGWALIITAICFVSPAHAGWDEFWYGVHVGWHRNNEWPEPFATADRCHAVSAFSVMIANGWERENLIGENYFDETSKHLNSAGVERIRFILRQAPVEHRTIFIQSDLNDDVTNMRVDAVQQTVAALQPKGPMPEVLVSNMVPEGRSAEMVAGEFKDFVTSKPSTRLSHSGGGGGGASNSASPSGSSGGTGGGN